MKLKKQTNTPPPKKPNKKRDRFQIFEEFFFLNYIVFPG